MAQTHTEGLTKSYKSGKSSTVRYLPRLRTRSATQYEPSVPTMLVLRTKSFSRIFANQLAVSLKPGKNRRLAPKGCPAMIVLAELPNSHNGPSALNQKAVDSDYERCYACHSLQQLQNQDFRCQAHLVKEYWS